jgi:outer membrane receptor protein involved in Fe transport
MRIGKIALLSGVALSMCILAPQIRAQEAPKSYDLPEQDLGDALRAVARMSDYQLVADGPSLKGRRAPSLAGAYTVEDAVAALLARSGLTADIAERTITLRGRETPSREAVTSATDIELSVTGSRIRGAKPTSPVISASRDKIVELGHNDLGSFARSIPQNYNGGQNPGVVSARQNGSENVTSSSALNLRGLGADATLTLLNGHRLAYDAVSQGIDISAIPLAAVERIEIVADGASALYGSDAVGGVANIILRRDFNGLETSARIGGATDGGAFQQQYSGVTGRRWNSGGIMIAGDFAKATDITASQRSYTDGAVNPEMTILPSNKQLSAVIAGHQSLGDVMEFGLDAHYIRRKSRFSLPNGSGTNIQSGATASPDVKSWSISPSLTFHLPANWDMTARFTRAISDSGVKAEVFSGSSRLFVNNVRYKNDLWSAEFSGEGPLFALPGGDARVALGAGLRANGLDGSIIRTTPATTFAIQNYTDSQTALFAYGEMFLPLIAGANGLPLIHSLQITGALRYERYDQIGSLATPKLGISYQPIADLTLKGAWGKSFKAPTLSQLNIAPQATLYAASRYLPAPPTQENVLQIDGSRKALEPEKARTLTFTVQLEPSSIAGLKLEASAFDVRYKNRVTYPIASSSQAFRQEYADLLILNPTLDQVLAATASLPLGVQNLSGTAYDPANLAAIVYTGYQNVARQHIQGVDSSISYAFFTGSSDFKLEANASYLKSDQQLSAGQPIFEQAGTIFRPPHWRGSANASWKRGEISMAIAYNYLGGTKDSRTSTTYRVNAFHSADATIGWKPQGSGLWAGWSFLLASQNILNRKPSLIRTTSVALPNYDATNYPAIGRTISLTLSKAW